MTEDFQAMEGVESPGTSPDTLPEQLSPSPSNTQHLPPPPPQQQQPSDNTEGDVDMDSQTKEGLRSVQHMCIRASFWFHNSALFSCDWPHLFYLCDIIYVIRYSRTLLPYPDTTPPYRHARRHVRSTTTL